MPVECDTCIGHATSVHVQQMMYEKCLPWLFKVYHVSLVYSRFSSLSFVKQYHFC